MVARRVKMSPKHEAIRKELKNTPVMYVTQPDGDVKAWTMRDVYRDWKVVYRMEGRKQTKLKFAEKPKAIRPDGWKCNDRANKYERLKAYRDENL